MNKIINKFLLTVDKFLPEFHLKQPGFTYSGDVPFTKYCKRFTEIVNLKHLYRHALDKACFVHDAAYSDSKYLAKITISDKTLKDKIHKTSRNRKYDGY